jgi:hypothetical protein
MWQAQTKLSGLVFILAGLLSVIAGSVGGVRANLEEDSAVAGVYGLIRAAGRQLPVVVSENSSTEYKQEIIGGSVTLRENRTFQWTTRYRYTERSKVTIIESSGGGAYKVEDDDITLSGQPGSTKLTGMLTGCSLSLKADVELVCKKQ